LLRCLRARPASSTSTAAAGWVDWAGASSTSSSVSGGRRYNFTMEGDVDHALLLVMLASVSLDLAGAETKDDTGG
jgi:hypothetical protein